MNCASLSPDHLHLTRIRLPSPMRSVQTLWPSNSVHVRATPECTYSISKRRTHWSIVLFDGRKSHSNKHGCAIHNWVVDSSQVMALRTVSVDHSTRGSSLAMDWSHWTR